jgi:RNA polymerase sigma factor (sigma-70 family)
MDDKTFEAMYEEHAAGLFGFLAYRTGDHALAEDLLADTFERALTARRPFDLRKGKAKTWLYTIALNRLRDTMRRQAIEGRALESIATHPCESNGDGPAEEVLARHVLMAAVERLTDEHREVVALRYGADLGLDEIAGLLKLRRRAVEGRLYRGLKQLRLELSGEAEPTVEARAGQS